MAPSTKGLSFKLPRGVKETDIHARLKKKSPWFMSISDPMTGADVKIPDETGVETGVLQLVQRSGFTIGSGGVGGLKICSPFINSYQSALQVDPSWNFQTTGTTTTPTTISWGAVSTGASFTNGLGYGFTGADMFKSVSNAHRVVSCAMYIQPEPSLSTNQGELCLFVQPYASITSPLYTDYQNLYKSVIVPINSNKASVVRWFPMSRQDWSFKSFTRTSGTVPSVDDDASTSFPNWTLGVLASGAATGTTIRVTMVVNYEFIPKNNTLNVLGASPSPQDVTETDLVENWVQDLPVAVAISQQRAAVSPSAVDVNHGENDSGTGFGMMFNVIRELAPIALSLL